MTGAKAEPMDYDSLITFRVGGMQGWGIIFKRLLDIVISSAALILLAPLFLVTSALIRLTSRGPALFVQKRLGLNKRIIGVYKFRTMVQDAEKKQAELEHLNEVSGPVFKIKNDPRITPIGRFLRKTSIDELPQLFNVLKGDMSLVGPRPLPIRDYQGFNKDWQRRRFSIRPGITCLWQINGRSSVQFERWMELDMEYIDRWSVWLDMKILIRTIPAVLRGSGAA
jgi:exopolysaccharide biosynthesis polyprenyl glycosylphosphotransferase